jgi:hypothetical protein
MNRSTRAITTILGISAAFLLFCGWYAIAANYDYEAVAGTYTLKLPDESSTLILKSDRTFKQELTHLGRVEHAAGSWRRLGEGGIAFSKEFLKVSGQEFDAEGTAYGEINKSLGLFFSISLNPGSPTFHKKLLG